MCNGMTILSTYQTQSRGRVEELIMDKYRITFETESGAARSRIFTGESEADAIEDFELWCEQFDYPPEFLNIVPLIEGVE